MNHPVTRSRRAAKTAAALACGAVGLGFAAGPAAAEGHGGGVELPDPETHTNLSAHVSCGDLTPEPECPNEFTIDVAAGLELLTTGTYTDAETGLEVTIGGVSINADGQAVFDFTSNLPVNSVFVRDGREGELYEFDQAVTSAEAVVSLTAAISELSFCYDDEEPPGDDTPPTSGPDDTTPPTTPEPTTPPADDTTTTSKPEETTTTVAPSTSVTTTPSTTISSDEELPNTGSNSTMVLVAVGAGLLAAGAALVLGTRRMWRRAA